MIAAIDLRAIRQPTAADPVGLRSLLQQIVGQPFLFFRPSYADEMTVHLGAPREAVSPKLQNAVRDSDVLTLRGSLWRLESPLTGTLTFSTAAGPGSPALRRLEGHELSTDRLVSPGVPVERAEPYFSEDAGGYVLLGFADGSRLVARPDRGEVSDSKDGSDEIPLPEIADWEILTP